MNLLKVGVDVEYLKYNAQQYCQIDEDGISYIFYNNIESEPVIQFDLN